MNFMGFLCKEKILSLFLSSPPPYSNAETRKIQIYAGMFSNML